MAKKYDTYLWPGKLYGIFTAYLSSLTYYITQTLQKIRCVSGTMLCWGKPKGLETTNPRIEKKMKSELEDPR